MTLILTLYVCVCLCAAGRSGGSDQIFASIVSVLLALMDGLSDRGQVLVIGATNRCDTPGHTYQPLLSAPGCPAWRLRQDMPIARPVRRTRNHSQGSSRLAQALPTSFTSRHPDPMCLWVDPAVLPVQA
jgi:hypothetical protein